MAQHHSLQRNTDHKTKDVDVQSNNPDDMQTGLMQLKNFAAYAGEPTCASSSAVVESADDSIKAWDRGLGGRNRSYSCCQAQCVECRLQLHSS